MDSEDDWIEIRFVGGPLDGGHQMVPAGFAVEGFQMQHPSPLSIGAIREAQASSDNAAMMPDPTWDRYVLRRCGADRWRFEHAGTLGSEPPIA